MEQTTDTLTTDTPQIASASARLIIGDTHLIPMGESFFAVTPAQWCDPQTGQPDLSKCHCYPTLKQAVAALLHQALSDNAPAAHALLDIIFELRAEDNRLAALIHTDFTGHSLN